MSGCCCLLGDVSAPVDSNRATVGTRRERVGRSAAARSAVAVRSEAIAVAVLCVTITFILRKSTHQCCIEVIAMPPMVIGASGRTAAAGRPSCSMNTPVLALYQRTPPLHRSHGLLNNPSKGIVCLNLAHEYILTSSTPGRISKRTYCESLSFPGNASTLEYRYLREETRHHEMTPNTMERLGLTGGFTGHRQRW